jgi:ADP-ribosyl-[dinitrogen reductase] hydrolase
MTNGLLQRFRGAMVGVHVGDSIGAPYETWGAKQIANDIEARGGLKFFDYPNPWAKDLGPKIMPAGRPTDDSDQTADLAYSLTECYGLDPVHLREALRDSVVHHKSRLWDGVATGAGGTTRNALSDDPVKVDQAMQNNIGTNGSLMRCVPMALWIYGTLGGSLAHHRDVAKMSRVTHNHPHSIAVCDAYTAVLTAILNENNKESCLNAMQSGTMSTALLARRVALQLQDAHSYPYDPGAWPGRGSAEFSLYAALWCFKHATSFADGIEKAVRIGGDTDTYAAIAGGLLGAYYGYDAIPEEWRTAILGHDVMYDFAQTLLCGKLELQMPHV